MAKLAYEFGLRRYDSGFEAYDQNSHTVRLMFEGDDMSQGETLKVGVSGALVQTAKSPEYGVTVDRSYMDVAGNAGLDLDLRHKFHGEAMAEIGMKKFLTDESGDDQHFNRVDYRIGMAGMVTRELRRHWHLAGNIGIQEVFSNTGDTMIETDESSYREVVLGVTAMGMW
jgi:hypothetical protein